MLVPRFAVLQKHIGPLSCELADQTNLWVFIFFPKRFFVLLLAHYIWSKALNRCVIICTHIYLSYVHVYAVHCI